MTRTGLPVSRDFYSAVIWGPHDERCKNSRQVLRFLNPTTAGQKSVDLTGALGF